VARLVAYAVAIVAFVAFATKIANGAEVLTPVTFTEAFAAAAIAAMPSAKVTILRNAYQVYRGDPARRDSIIQRYVSVLADTVSLRGPAPPVDRSRIVPVLKASAWVEAVQRQRHATPAAQLLTEPFTDELTVVYAEDRPSSMRLLMTRDDVGDRSGLRTLALGNLSRLLPKIAMRQAADGVFLVGAGGEYEPSLLLVDALWSSGQIKVEGDIIVAAPAKGAVLVTGARNATGIAHLRAFAARLASGPYGLTAVLYVYRGGKFVRLDD
jgi:uncharacterized protein YtpQ (UPF0354 family)